MSAIPLHLQRRFEQRWASRFTLPVASNAPRNVGTKATPLTVAARGKDQRKTHRVETAGFKQVSRCELRTSAIAPSVFAAGHLNDAQGTGKRLDRSTDRLLPARRSS
jgi:hypothetical protein